MLADGCLGDDELAGDRGVGVAFGDEGEDLAFACGQRRQRVAAAPHQLAYHLGIDHGAAGGHAAQRGDEVLDIGHSVFEQVADAAAVAGVEQVRGRPRSVAAPGDEEAVPDSGQPPAPVPSAAAAVLTAGQAVRPARPAVYQPLPRAAARPGRAFWRLLAGELRILVQGTSRWWWLVAAAVNLAGLAVPPKLVKPTGASTALLLSAAWIWPVLIWSRLGIQRRENGLETLLGAYPGAIRQLAAEWTAGLALTAMTGLGPVLRMAIAADGPRVAAWTAGAVFIPSLALLLGTASRTHRMFQALYVILWYAAVNQLAAADYMGTVLVNGRPAGPSPR